MYVIKNGDYYLSNQYEIAAEIVLGYGGVWSKTDIKQFKTKKEALKEVKLMRRSFKSVEIIKL